MNLLQTQRSTHKMVWNWKRRGSSMTMKEFEEEGGVNPIIIGYGGHHALIVNLQAKFDNVFSFSIVISSIVGREYQSQFSTTIIESSLTTTLIFALFTSSGGEGGRDYLWPLDLILWETMRYNIDCGEWNSRSRIIK